MFLVVDQQVASPIKIPDGNLGDLWLEFLHCFLNQSFGVLESSPLKMQEFLQILKWAILNSCGSSHIFLVKNFF